MQASGLFCLDLLSFALRLRAVTPHVANFATEVTFPRNPSAAAAAAVVAPNSMGAYPLFPRALPWFSRRFYGRGGMFYSDRCQDPENHIALLALSANVMA